MVRFGKRSAWYYTAGGTSTPAEIRDVKYGLVHTTSTGADATYDRHEASKKVTLQVEPAGGQPYEATLKIERCGRPVPDVTANEQQAVAWNGPEAALATGGGVARTTGLGVAGSCARGG
jgi:hypothetical protein